VTTEAENADWMANKRIAKLGAYSGKVGDVVEKRVASGGVETCRTAISVEFVTKPNQAQRVRGLVPTAITQTFDGIAGFAGCAVMVSEHEERLVTVLTFWRDEAGDGAIGENARWVCRLLEPYMDHKLRVQTMRSHLAMLSAAAPEPFLSECASRVA
jgi:hypothetical protein